MHINYEAPNLPYILNVFSWFPKSIRQSLFVKPQAPTADMLPLDVFDVLEEDPYTIEVVETDKIWRVEYMRGGSDPAGLSFFGIANDKTNYDKILRAAELEGKQAVEQFKQDWARFVDALSIDPEKGKKGEYCRIMRAPLYMFVVKLESGDILLYAPIKIRDNTNLSKWIDELGIVKYIVIGSGSHTLYLPSTLERYPDALVIGPTIAQLKLQYANALIRKKVDYNSIIPAEMDVINKELISQGVTLHNVDGDAAHALVVLAYNTILQTDLIYKHHEDTQFISGTQNLDDPLSFITRLYIWRLVSRPNSPFGYLPGYRFAMMDPSNLWHSLVFSSGSSCTKMAESLRKILKLQFTQAADVHSDLLVSAQDFKKTINVAWNWLDERSLIADI